MRVLFDHPVPFSLTHGGFQTQIEQTWRALRDIGVDVEPLRWWDDSQRGDIIHYFGRPPRIYVESAHNRGIKVVMAELLTETGSRGRNALRLQKSMIRLAQKWVPSAFTTRIGWDAYRLADAAVALTAWEAELMHYLFDAPAERLHVVPNGVEAEFFQSPAIARGKWLVCSATITERKRVAELVEASVQAGTPIWIIGKPYSEQDAYWARFQRAIQGSPDLVRYEGPIYDRAKLAAAYREARGFVLLSTMESLSLSALEAAACECPLLLSDLPWARTVFGQNARYCSVTAGPSDTARCLRQFYDSAPSMRASPKPVSWKQVADQLKGVYQRLIEHTKAPRAEL